MLFPFGTQYSFLECTELAAFKDLPGIKGAEQLNGLGYQPCPACLMACAEAGTVVAVEVFIKENVIAPIGIALKFLGPAIDRSSSLFIAQEDTAQAIRDLLADFEEVHHLS